MIASDKGPDEVGVVGVMVGVEVLPGRVRGPRPGGHPVQARYKSYAFCRRGIHHQVSMCPVVAILVERLNIKPGEELSRP